MQKKKITLNLLSTQTKGHKETHRSWKTYFFVYLAMYKPKLFDQCFWKFKDIQELQQGLHSLLQHQAPLGEEVEQNPHLLSLLGPFSFHFLEQHSYQLLNLPSCITPLVHQVATIDSYMILIFLNPLSSIVFFLFWQPPCFCKVFHFSPRILSWTSNSLQNTHLVVISSLGNQHEALSKKFTHT